MTRNDWKELVEAIVGLISILTLASMFAVFLYTLQG